MLECKGEHSTPHVDGITPHSPCSPTQSVSGNVTGTSATIDTEKRCIAPPSSCTELNRQPLGNVKGRIEADHKVVGAGTTAQKSLEPLPAAAAPGLKDKRKASAVFEGACPAGGFGQPHDRSKRSSRVVEGAQSIQA